MRRLLTYRAIILVIGLLLFVVGLIITNTSETVGTLLAVAGLLAGVPVVATWPSDGKRLR